MTPAVPFIFRNYEYSPDSQPPRASAPPNDEASLYELGGSSKHLVWQAVRASSAAPYYLDDFVCGQDRYLFSIPKLLFSSKTSYLTGYLNSETPGDSKNVFLHCEDVSVAQCCELGYSYYSYCCFCVITNIVIIIILIIIVSVP